MKRFELYISETEAEKKFRDELKLLREEIEYFSLKMRTEKFLLEERDRKAGYDSKTNTFGIYRNDGKTVTFYKPVAGEKYFRDFTKTQTSRGGRIINSLPSRGSGSGGGITDPKKPFDILPDDDLLE